MPLVHACRPELRNTRSTIPPILSARSPPDRTTPISSSSTSLLDTALQLHLETSSTSFRRSSSIPLQRIVDVVVRKQNMYFSRSCLGSQSGQSRRGKRAREPRAPPRSREVTRHFPLPPLHSQITTQRCNELDLWPAAWSVSSALGFPIAFSIASTPNLLRVADTMRSRALGSLSGDHG